MKSEASASRTPGIIFLLLISTAVLATMFVAFLLMTIPVCGCAPEPPQQNEQHAG